MTGVAVRLNRTNYTRYETTDRATLIAAVILVGAVADEVVTIALNRDAPGGHIDLLTETHTVTAPEAAAGGFTWVKDLRVPKDAHGVHLARISQKLRDYSIVVTPASGTAAEAPFTITPVSVEDIRNRWCMGLPLRSVAFMMPRSQPVAITGVTVVSIGQGARPNTLQVLDFDFVTAPGPSKIKWAGGAYMDIPAIGVSRLVLVGADVMNYAVVEIDPTKLPGADVQETLILDYAPMTDDQILQNIFDVYGDVQTFLQVYLEPTYVASRNLVDPARMASLGGPVTPVDVVAEPVAYYIPSTRLQSMSFRLPVNNIQEILQISGWLNQNRLVDFPDDLITCTKRTGFVELVPSNQIALVWSVTSPMGLGLSYFTSFEHLANFWNFHAISGLPEMPSDIGSFIAKRAAVAVLIQAGQAQNPTGVISKSISRDGVSEGSSLMPGGLYAATINQYLTETGRDADGNENLLGQYRERYRGWIMTTL